MASAPRPSSRPKQTWRERSRPQETPREVKLVQRWLASLVLLALVAAMAWVVYKVFFQPQTVIVCLPVTNYGKYRVPPVPFFENDARYLAEVDEDMEKLITFGERDSLDQLTENLNKFGLRAQDTLILYVSAHGVSLARNGKTTKGYLLCGDKVGDDNEGDLIEIGDFLNRVRKCTAAHKIILLDAGHIGAAPQLGMMVNEFPKYLEKAVHALEDETVWVLSANALRETSHVVHSKSQSVFNDFVVRGLKGEADAGPNANSFVDLSELVVFVGNGVRDWVRSQYGNLEHQTPQVLWSGGRITTGVIDGQMQNIILSRALPPPAPDAEVPQAETKAPKSAAARSPRGQGLLSSSIMPRGLALGQPSPAPTQPAPTQPAAAPPAAAPPAESTPKPDAPASPAGAAPASATQATPASTTPAPPAPSPVAPPPTAVSPVAAGDLKAAEKQSDVPDPLAGLRAAWKERDAVLKAESNPWSPVDYAPHTWRVLESSLLDFEVRYRNALGKKPDFEPVDSPRQIAAAGSKFAESRTPVETSGVIHDALRARNRGIYRAIDLVAWHCRASLGRSETLLQFEPIRNLLRQLEDLETRLSDLASKPEDVDAERLEAELKELTADINQALTDIDESLVRSINAELQGSTTGPLPKDLARELEDLLSIPLIDTSIRMRLVEALTRVGEQRKEKATRDSERQSEISAPNRVIKQLEEAANSAADSKAAMARATEQARLEWRLIKLANLHQEGPQRKNLEELLPTTGDASLEELAKFGYELVGVYRSLPDSVAKDRANPWHADGELRLQPAYQRTSFEVCVAVARDAHWTLPEKPEVALSSPVTTLSLDADSKWFPVTLQVAAIGKFTGTVLVHAAYDKSKLKLESVNDNSAASDTQSPPIKLDADHPSAQLQYRAQRLGLAAGEVAQVTFVATSPEHPKMRRELPIGIEAPSPNDIDLVIAPAGGIDGPDGPQLTNINQALVSDVKARDDRNAMAAPRRVRLSTFAGHQTAFDFKLRHQLSHDRKVKVELYAVSERDPLKLEELYHLAAKDPQKFVEGLGKPQSPGKKVAEAKELLLPKNGTQGVPIEWTAFPSPTPAKDAPAAAAATEPPKSEPERALLDGGLICVVQETGQDTAPWITWVEVAPYAPDQYIAPRVRYEGSGRLRVDLGLTAEARPLDGRKIHVELEDSPDIKLRVKKSAELLPKNGFRDWVQAEVSDTGDSPQTIEVRLAVDGYPRAFIYRLTPLDRNLPNGKELWERNLTSLAVIEPHKLDCFKPEPDGKSRVPVRLQVTAPSNRFIRNRPFREQVKDTIEVGIDDDDDGRPNPPLRNFYSDRLTTLKLGPIESGGRLAIDTAVDDLQFELPCPDLNKHANLVAVLKFDGQEADSVSVECVFDDRPPEAPVAPELALMYLGEKKTLKVTATDGEQGSGIKAIHYAYNTVDRNEANKKPIPPLTVSNNQSEFEVPFSEEWTSAGRKQMIVWSEDKVGLLSKPAEVLVDVKPKPAMAADKPAAKFGTIRGKVTYGGRPVARATVGVAKGAGPTKTLERATKTDSDGKFEIKNLAPGDYPLEAEGTARNQLRKSKEPVTVTIPTPPQEKPVEVEIKL